MIATKNLLKEFKIHDITPHSFKRISESTNLQEGELLVECTRCGIKIFINDQIMYSLNDDGDISDCDEVIVKQVHES